MACVTMLLLRSLSRFVLSSPTCHCWCAVSCSVRHNNSHVILPKELSKSLPKGRLLSEREWRGVGVQQSRGWAHYAMHRPEPHILLFRRPLGTDPTTGEVDPVLARKAKLKYQKEFGIVEDAPTGAGAGAGAARAPHA